MSYITLIGTETMQKHLAEKQEKLLSDIRKIVGSKKFTFSDAYLKKRQPTIGIGTRPFSTITKKNLYVSCFVQYTNNHDNTEYGAVIKKLPVCYQRGSGTFVERVALEDLFISDLELILRELKFYLWWETCVRMPKVRAEYNEVAELEKRYNKMKADLHYMPEVDDKRDVALTHMKLHAVVGDNLEY